MSSKERGGLSKREYAAKMSGGTLNYKTGKISTPAKKSSSSSSKKTSDPFAKYTSMDWGSAVEAAKKAGLDISTGSAFDLAMNKKYNPSNYSTLIGSKQQGPLMESGDFYSKDTSSNRALNQSISEARSKASKASSSSNPTWQPSWQTKSLAPTPTPTPTPTPVSRKQPHQQVWDFLTGLGGMNKYANQLGGKASPFSLGEQQSTADPILQEMQQGQDRPIPNLIGQPEPALGMSSQYNEQLPWQPDWQTQPVEQPGAYQDYQPQQEPEVMQEPQGPPPMPAMPNPTVQYPRSSGILGNGAGISSGAGLDPATAEYIKSLQKSAGGDFGMKDAKKELENLLNEINKDYKEQQRVGENKLGESKTEDLNKLMSLFGAYNTADSEQRMQTQERVQNQYRNSLREMLTQMQASRSKDVSSAKSGALNTFQQIQQRQQQAQQQVAQLIYQAQQDAMARQAASQKTAKPSYNPANFYGAASEMKNQGTGWGDIAGTLGQNYDLTPGSEYSQQLDAIMTGQAPQQPKNLISLGNGLVLDKDTGDVFSTQ